MEKYLAWRGCGAGPCMLMLGVTSDKRTARHALRRGPAPAGGYGAVYIGPAMGQQVGGQPLQGLPAQHPVGAGLCGRHHRDGGGLAQVKPLMLAMEQAARDVFEGFGQPVHAFTHLSHLYPQGSSIYSQYVWPIAPGGFAPNFERWQKFKAAVADTIAAHGGTVSHQHGVGRDHAAHLVDEKARWAWPPWPSCAAISTRTAS